MSKTKPEAEPGRRAFLKMATVGAPVVAAAAVATPEEAEAAALEAAGEGLRKTEHVKKYLASARF